MSEKTIIAWTEKTFNGLWGCREVSPGCARCYAAALSKRYGHDVWRDAPRREFGHAHWNEPLKWERDAVAEGRRIRVFCGSMWDWREDHPQVDAVLPRLHDLWRATPHLDWQMLTKRSERIAPGLPADWCRWSDGYPNVWLGVSIENADYACRADRLRAIPAAVRFVSYEPALGPLASALDLTGIDWVIYGGESGPKFRAHDPQWARDMGEACEKDDVAWFFKQSAAIRTEMGIELDGRIQRAWPIPRSSTFNSTGRLRSVEASFP